MNKTIKISSLVVTFISLIACSIWLYNKPGYDSGTATIASLGAFIGSLFIDNGDEKGNTKMSQRAGDNSNLYQSKESMTINNK